VCQIDLRWCFVIVLITKRLSDGDHDQFAAQVLQDAKGSQFMDEFVDFRQIQLLVLGYLVCLADQPPVVGGEKFSHVGFDPALVPLEALFAFQPGLGLLAEADGGGWRWIGADNVEPDGVLSGEDEGTGDGHDGHGILFQQRGDIPIPTAVC